MIRMMEHKDLDACVSICEENFKRMGYSYDIRKELLSSFEGGIVRPEFFVFDDGSIKGLGGIVSCLFDDEVFSLLACYVRPSEQGKGIGKELTKERLQRIKELGGRIVFSTTKEVWHLKRFGFKVIQSPYDEWRLMQLVLK